MSGFSSILPFNFGSCVSGGTYGANYLIFTPNQINTITLSGPDAAHFAVLSGTPIPAFPAQKTISLTFSPNANRVFNATLNYTFTIGGKPFFASAALTGTGVPAGTAEVGFNFPSIGFPPTTVGTPVVFPGVELVNLSNIAITVVSLAFFGGDFVVTGGPAFPLVLAPGASSAPFLITWTPGVVGSDNDTLTATLNTAGTGTMQVSGTGIQITPVFNLTGATQGTLFGFSGEIDELDPEDFNCEEPASFVRLHDWNIPNVEKQMMRVRGHYQDYGPAIITITVQCRRVVQPGDPAVVKNTTITKDVPIGTTGATDGWNREFIADIEITDELIQVGISRAANSGPAFIVDYTPCLEPKGEVVEAT